MGFNTVAFMLNDMASDLERMPQLGSFLRDCMSSGRGGNLGQRIRVLPSVHADVDQVVMAGGNRITPIAVLHGCDHTEEALMRALAKRLGFSVRRKPTP